MGQFKELLSQQRAVILHGALGTELEARGYDISGELWSAKYLLNGSDAITKIHEAYVLAGADIITTSTYQASLASLQGVGISKKEAESLIIKSVELAKIARKTAWEKIEETAKSTRIYPLISGDVGPYAAYLADGSEYTGDYGQISKETLKDFHRSRIALFLKAGVDLLALETMPNLLEIKALIELLVEEFPDTEVYLSITSQDGESLSDGTDLKEMVRLVQQCPQIVALGVNCSSPTVCEKVLSQLVNLTSLPLVAHPNSGEVYHGATQTWHASDSATHEIASYHKRWQEKFEQLTLVGGCCRTRPDDIEKIRESLSIN
ncbi:homocysteine S-methyltransferase [Streptococcus thoraltensis]|uniref:homocysteine S-methyltransferase n=1 Tax=Streptococcus thoraltensis TaxID=55085 RepID=UPI001F58EE34|nr:homocysteine S-methyltransferase [Streptococcus thoraltensis]